MAIEPLFGTEGPNNRAVGAPPVQVGVSDPQLQWALKQVTRAEPKVNQWREKAKECQRFFANKQLSDEDERLLREQQRPTNAFNTTQKFIRYISGVQRDSYTSLLFNAVQLDNTKAQLFGERIGTFYNWACTKAGADLKRSRAFVDQLITGMGWTGCYMSRARDPRGLVGYDRLDPMEMLWPDVSEINLDAEHCRWRAREAWIENEEAKALFTDPQAHFLIEHAEGGAAAMNWPSVDRVPYKIPYVQSYPLGFVGTGKPKKDRSRIMEFQWWDNDAGYLFEDPLDNTEQFMTEEEFREYKTQLQDLFGMEIDNYDRQIGRKWMRMFVLNRQFLLETPSPLPGSRFTFNPLCCHFDDHDRLWYGFMRVMMDPQRYINKFFNQMLEAFAKQAKGGYMAEISAFDDQAQVQEFKDTAAVTGSINIVADNALKENRIVPKQMPETPAAAMAIMQFVISAMGDTITGINAESLGMGAGTTPGVTMKRRQRAGMVLLAAEFDAESQFRKEEGYIVYDHLKLISDDRLIRVGGAYDGEVLKLENAPFSLEYEIQLDEAERDPSLRQYLSELLMGPFGQTLLRMNKFLPVFLDVLPLPRRWIESIKQAMQQDAQMQQQLRMQGLPIPGSRGQQKGPMQIQAEVDEKKSRTALQLAKAERLAKQSGNEQVKMLIDALQKSMEEKRQQQSHGADLARSVVETMNMARNGGTPTE